MSKHGKNGLLNLPNFTKVKKDIERAFAIYL